MRSRWFHVPSVHSPSQGNEKKVGWLELFYDLIYVATFIQLGNALSLNLSISGALSFAGLMVPLWITWNAYTFYANRFDVDDLIHRLLVFVQMFAIGGMAVSVTQVFGGQTTQFAAFYAASRAVIVLFYLRTYWQQPDARDLTGAFSRSYGVGLALWLASCFLPTPWVYLCWALATFIDLVQPFGRAIRSMVDRYPPDILHMSERYGLLTLIVLGESFVKVLSSISEVSGGPASSLIITCAMGLAIVTSLWWIYFDDVAGSRIKANPMAGFAWIYAHIPMTIAAVATGVSIKKAVFFDLSTVAPEGYRWLLCSSLALVLFSVAAIDSVTERRQSEFGDRIRTGARLFSAFFVVLLAPVGAAMPSWIFLLLLAAICVAQVILDLLTAPLEADEEMLREGVHQVWGSGQTEENDGQQTIAKSGVPPRPDFKSSIRKGTPSELRRDIYFQLMDGSWTALFATLIFVFLLANGVFAGLYILEPNSIANTASQSFGDAFSFSVQTMSTIGYGTLSPETTYANILVTCQAIFGISFTAMATGLIFAKVSRPASSILFSNPILVTTFHGKPTLLFRVGNARGNEIVEASVSAAVFVNTVSPEGHALGRMFNLKLVRSNTPLFMFTWQVMHVIDEDSPLFGSDASSIADDIQLVVMSITGHDATYGQTIHGRKLYYPEHFQFDRRFVDVMTTLDDGRIMIDYTGFHNTISDNEVELPHQIDESEYEG
ncbi:MAG: low temperature requirement protein A [Kofleriaceae bacterium]|nr:low temperature requirement protein A [Kofleriaceae bacterium]